MDATRRLTMVAALIAAVALVAAGTSSASRQAGGAHRGPELRPIHVLAQGADSKSMGRQPLRCPARKDGPVREAPLRGLELATARVEAARRGCVLRVVRADGINKVITADFNNTRVNVITREGLVVGVDGIY